MTDNLITADPSNGDDLIAGVVGLLAGGLGGWAGGVYAVYKHFSGYGPGLKDWKWLITGHHIIVPMTSPTLWSYLPAPAAIAGALAGGALSFFAFHRQAEIHIRGAKWSTPRQIQQSLTPKGTPKGVPVGTIHLPEVLERHHILLIGSTGGGKTTALWPLLEAARERGDKMLVLSTKHDFEAKWRGPFSLLSPFDKRGARWILGRDVRTHLDAQSLAETLIKGNEKEPMWSDGARALLVGLIADMQTKMGDTWSARDIGKSISESLATFKVLKAIIERENPVAATILAGGADSRTVASFIVNLVTAVIPIINLGVSDYASNAKSTWSVKDWLGGKTPATTIIGWRDSAKSMSRSWAASLIEQTVRQVMDMHDTPPDKRRIWLILDEVAQAGKIPSITQALETGRSKGLRVVLGAQSLAQIRREYDKETAQIWEGQTGTKIITRLESTDEQQWASKMVGEREIERFTRSLSQQHTSGGNRQSSTQYTRIKEPLMMPNEFKDTLDTNKHGVRIVFISGKHQTRARVPFLDLPEQRQASIDSGWLSPTYKRPFWGKIPPTVETPSTQTDGDDTKKPQQKKQQQAAPVTHQAAPPAPAPKPPTQETAGDEAASKTLDALLKTVAPAAGIALDLAKLILAVPTPAAEAPAIAPKAPEPQADQGFLDGSEDAADESSADDREPEAGD